MSHEAWYDVIARIPQEAPTDLDPILGGQPPSPAPPESGTAPHVLSASLWDRDENASYIGVRVDQAPQDIRRLALRLASAAAERGVVPIILSSLPRTGFEQFGFRVERLPEGPPEAVVQYEAELRKFWDLPIVLGLSDIERLG